MALASGFMAVSRFRLHLRTLPENLTASRAALMRIETAALRISRFSAMVPLPKPLGPMEVNSEDIIAFDGGKM